MELLPQTRCLVGKTNGQDESAWLPLWMHGRDTADVMAWLVQCWLPQSVKDGMRANHKNKSKDELDLDEALLCQTARFLGLTHDIGKATMGFQEKILSGIPEARERIARFLELKKLQDPPLHARASEAILLYLGCPEGLASVAGAHHGKPQNNNLNCYIDEEIEDFPKKYYGENSTHTQAEWDAIWQDLLKDAMERSGFHSVEELPKLTEETQILLTGLLTMGDWISSNTAYFPLIPVEDMGKEAFYPQRTDRGWSRLSLTMPWEPTCFSMKDSQFLRRFGFLPNEVQKAMLDVVGNSSRPGIIILEAQMGIGKTEAALSGAEIVASRCQAGGLFFGLPTQATANGIFDRLEAWAEAQSEETAHSIRLAHGMAEFNEAYHALPHETVSVEQDEDSEENGVLIHSWFQGNKRALLSDFVVGTVDQLLMAALKQKHVMLRHLGLAGKVVIIDECHAYDAYMNCYLDRVLSWLGVYQVPVILLSATLPARRRAELVKAYERNLNLKDSAWTENRGYPLLTWTELETKPPEGNDSPQRIVQQKVISMETQTKNVLLERITEDRLFDCLKERMKDGGCVGIVVNTVKKAQSLVVDLRKDFSDFEVVLFHAQYLMADREEKEQKLRKRLGKHCDSAQRNRLIVVGTQVLEQSLDIDFDLLVTELCPMDLLLQRIGRLHRHNREDRPIKLQTACCMVLDTNDDSFDSGSVAVYKPWLLWRTRKLLPNQISLPEDIPHLIQDTYSWDTKDCLPEDAESIALKENYMTLQDCKRTSAEIYAIAPPSDEQTSLDDWMKVEGVFSEMAALAAVRDGAPSIDVLLMVRHSDGRIHFLPWQENGRAVDSGRIPSSEDALAIAKQRLRLPGYFGKQWNIDNVIRELEEENLRFLPLWQNAPLLKGKLVLLLDETFHAHLVGTILHYDKDNGLTYEKKEGNDEGH